MKLKKLKSPFKYLLYGFYAFLLMLLLLFKKKQLIQISYKNKFSKFHAYKFVEKIK